MDDCSSLNVLLASWAPFRAGAEVAAERLAIGLRDAGHRVTFVVGIESETLGRMRAAGIDVRHVPLAFTDKLKWLRYRASQQALRRLILELQPDVVHANDLPTSQMVGQVVRRAGIPLVTHHRWIFGGTAIDWLNKFGADRHLFVSNALMSELIGNSPRLASSPRAVVYDGLQLPPLPTHGERRAARGELALPVDKDLVLYAGQLIERKGVADLLRAWTLMSDQRRSTATLVVVGDDLENEGKYRVELERLNADLGCGAKFMGYRKDVAAWITAADLCVVPSHAEPLGNATLEAMAHGRAVVATRVGGIPEMVVDGVTGVLVPLHSPQSLAEAIEQMLADAKRRDARGLAARQRAAEKFSIEKHVASMVAEYRQVISKRLQSAS